MIFSIFKFGKNKNNYKSYDNVLSLIKDNLIYKSKYFKPIIIQMFLLKKTKNFGKKNMLKHQNFEKISKISNVQICENLSLNKIFDQRNWDIAGLPYNNKAIINLS